MRWIRGMRNAAVTAVVAVTTIAGSNAGRGGGLSGRTPATEALEVEYGEHVAGRIGREDASPDGCSGWAGLASGIGGCKAELLVLPGPWNWTRTPQEMERAARSGVQRASWEGMEVPEEKPKVVLHWLLAEVRYCLVERSSLAPDCGWRRRVPHEAGYVGYPEGDAEPVRTREMCTRMGLTIVKIHAEMHGRIPVVNQHRHEAIVYALRCIPVPAGIVT